MQSPHKLRQRLDELQDAPGPEASGIELALRSVVALTAPTIREVIDSWTPDMLDDALEQVAMWFLSIRSDDQALSPAFRQALDALAAPAQLAPADPGQQPAPAPAADPVVPASAPTADPAVTQPDPSSPTQGAAPPAAPTPPWG